MIDRDRGRLVCQRGYSLADEADLSLTTDRDFVEPTRIAGIIDWNIAVEPENADARPLPWNKSVPPSHFVQDELSAADPDLEEICDDLLAQIP